jgi:hypothetical protein
MDAPQDKKTFLPVWARKDRFPALGNKNVPIVAIKVNQPR